MRDGGVEPAKDDTPDRSVRLRRRRAGPYSRHARKNKRSRPHVFARDGHRSAADARRRSGHCQAHRARPAAGPEDDHARAADPEGASPGRRGSAQWLALDQGNRPVRRRRADRREDRSKDQGNAEADRQDRQALFAGDEAGGEAREGSAGEKAFLPARQVRRVAHAHRDVRTDARSRFQSARKEAADRQDSPDRRARSFPRARNRQARAPRGSFQGRSAGRSPQGSCAPAGRNSAKSKSPAK